jgi:hypothetical protein
MRTVDGVISEQIETARPTENYRPPKRSPLLKRKQFEGQWCGRPLEMLESPGFRVLSLSGHRFLARLEIELRHHGGHDNGRLPCTFEDAVAYGIGDRHCASAAMREVVALGFVERTEQGRAGNAEFRSPNRWRLTYLPTGRAAATNEWRRIETVKEARAIVRRCRSAPRDIDSSGGIHTMAVVVETPTGKNAFQCGNPPPKRGENHHWNSKSKLHGPDGILTTMVLDIVNAQLDDLGTRIP